ncbi:condensation domain-containing protein [Burkholderia cenocepacia]|uniref:condensation domain-containing protein n=1 Tax=Burkholderia cenocepacia TaxID=95486 RepID=UPI00158E61D6|nr:condensation domain-containing protein [Burkholderia cenocepacia]
MIDSTLQLPLSAPQRDFWEAALAYPVPSTHIYAAEYFEIRGALDTDAFERALRQVIREAQTLHTTRIVLDGDTPVRVLDAALADDWALERVDLAGTKDAHAVALAGMRAHCTGAIELARGPFFRHTLYRIAPDHYYWYHGYAHILVDGYSGSLIATRAAELYSAFAAGAKAPPARFASLAELQLDEDAYRASEQFAHDRRYWLERFADQPRTVTLAGPARFPERDDGPDLRETRIASASESTRIEAVAKGLFTSTVPRLVTALTAAYLYLNTGAHDIVLSVAAMARTSARERRTPTQCANMLPLRLHVEPGHTLDDLCRQANREMTALRQHQRYRMGDLHRELTSLDNGQGVFGPEINIMAFDYNLRFGDCVTTSHNLSVGTTDDLMVNLTDRRNGEPLRFDFDASPQYYSRDALNAHVGQFLTFMRVALDEPFATLGALESRLDFQPAALAG